MKKIFFSAYDLQTSPVDVRSKARTTCKVLHESRWRADQVFKFIPEGREGEEFFTLLEALVKEGLLLTLRVGEAVGMLAVTKSTLLSARFFSCQICSRREKRESGCVETTNWRQQNVLMKVQFPCPAFNEK